MWALARTAIAHSVSLQARLPAFRRIRARIKKRSGVAVQLTYNQDEFFEQIHWTRRQYSIIQYWRRGIRARLRSSLSAVQFTDGRETEAMEVTDKQSTHKETKESSADQFTVVRINKPLFRFWIYWAEVTEPSYSFFTRPRARGYLITVLRQGTAGNKTNLCSYLI